MSSSRSCRSFSITSRSASPPPVSKFSCRIVYIDYYIVSPIKNLDVIYSDFGEHAISKVPLIRIFGATPSGQKACLHVHGVFPYLYVPCITANPNEKYLHQFCDSINHALQVSLGTNDKDSHYVYNIVVTKGIPFYGYHSSERLFLKIYLFNPGLLKRLAELLLAGAVHCSLQPHEAHIPFALQFMIDYSLYGMNYIHCQNVKFRLDDSTDGAPASPLYSPMSPSSSVVSSTHGLIEPSLQFWDVSKLPREYLVLEPRVSNCELEADIQAYDIMNTQEIDMVSGSFPGLTALWKEERERRLALNITDDLEPPLTPERQCSLVHDAERKHREKLQSILDEVVTQHSPPDTPSVVSSESFVVDEELVHKHMELSQRLSSVSFNSSDAELYGILQDLAHAPSEKSIAQDLHNRIKRSLSVTSSVSLFSRSSKHSNMNVLTQIPKERNTSSPLSDVELFSEASDDGHFEQELKVNTEADCTQDKHTNTTPLPTMEYNESLSHFLSSFSDSGRSLGDVGVPPAPVSEPPGATDVVCLSQHERLQLIQLCREGDSSSESAEEEIEEEMFMSEPFWDSSEETERSSMEPQWEDSITQLDGAFDHGKSTSKKKRKRLGLVSSRKRHTCSQRSNTWNTGDQSVTSHNLRSHTSSVIKKTSPETVPERQRHRSLPLEISLGAKQSPTPIKLKAVHSETRESIDKAMLSCNLKNRALSQTLFPFVEKLQYPLCLGTNTSGHIDEEGVDSTLQTPSPQLLQEPSTEGSEDEEFRLALSTSESELHHSKSLDEDFERESDFNLVLSATESESEPEVVSKPQTLPGEHIHCSTHWKDTQVAHPPVSYIISPQSAPPKSNELMQTTMHGMSYQGPYYSDPRHVQQPQEIGGKSFFVPSSMAYELKEFAPLVLHPAYSWCNLEHWRTVANMKCSTKSHSDGLNGKYKLFQDHAEDLKKRSKQWRKGFCVITPVLSPPKPWTLTQSRRTEASHHSKEPSLSGAEGPSINNSYGLKLSSNTPAHDSEVQFITTMSVDMHIRSRQGLKPDPEWDPVLAMFYHIHNDWSTDDQHNDSKIGVIAIDLNSGSVDVVSPANRKSPHPSTPVKQSPRKHTPVKQSPKKHTPVKQSPSKWSPLNVHSPAKKLLGQSSDRQCCNDIIDDDDVTRPYLDHCGLSPNIEVAYVQSEKCLFDELVKLVRQHDPDILLAYNVERESWGYLIDRSRFLNIDLIDLLGRIPSNKSKQHNINSNHVADTYVIGRIIMNLWRIIKNEVSLLSYTFQNVMFHVLHHRIPQFSHQTLTEWYEHPNRLFRHRVVEYYMTHCCGYYKIVEKLNLIGRTSEMARLYGTEFFNALARGSQYRVESMLLRLAKPANYIAVSPSVLQRARMAAPECLPLILEPESKLYTDPVLVLDFQSLYPSMVIGYNYCYSTCLGRVEHFCDADFPFGTCSLSIPPDTLMELKDDVTISPNGVVFLKPHVRPGILPRMLEEILNTRVMIKQSMKMHKNNKVLRRILDARQLALKLIANTTYGYTAANYSGRMPCVEVADSIVSKGRETLKRAIQLVQSTKKWKAQVVYGDTDSMFILLKEVSKDEAFKIGKEICDAVTQDNPVPIKLKFEKVYLPCILQSKKRYVGYSYESSEQVEPMFDAKGIETVRRDGCPAVNKILGKLLRLLFETKDLSVMKAYLLKQCTKLINGNVSLQDYTIAREYRGRGRYRPGACVPALELAKERGAIDRCNEPLAGERVPYIIVYGSPGLPLIKLVTRPEDIFSNPSLRLNATYYITKQILPAVDRCLCVLGVDVFQWYKELPRIQRPAVRTVTSDQFSKKSAIGQYFTSLHCILCDCITTDIICVDCSVKQDYVTLKLSSFAHIAEQKCKHLSQLCQDCCGNQDSGHFLECISQDCPVLYSRQTALSQLKQSEGYLKTLCDYLDT